MKLKIYIVSTGSEITAGRSVDTNSVWIANELSGLGFSVQKISILPDDPYKIKEELEIIKNKKEKSLIIMTGGLGATEDDYTLSTLCTMLNVIYVPYQPAVDKLLELAALRGKQYSDLLDIIKRQTCIPEGSIPLHNDVGIAVGFIARLSEDVRVAALPGVPQEMKEMFTSYFIPIFKELYGINNLYHIERYIWLMGESLFQNKYIANNPLITKEVVWGVTAKPGYIKVTFTSEQEGILKEISKDLNEKIVNVLDTDILQELHSILCKSQKTLATAESCTGGLIAKNITDRPGSSAYFLGSVVSYHNDIKHNVLNVKQTSLEKYGAVSKEVATEMAEGLEKLFGSDYSISVTGIAGPGGGTETKKVGLVFIGIKVKGESVDVHCFEFPLKREMFREHVANTALFLLYKKIIGLN